MHMHTQAQIHDTRNTQSISALHTNTCTHKRKYMTRNAQSISALHTNTCTHTRTPHAPKHTQAHAFAPHAPKHTQAHAFAPHARAHAHLHQITHPNTQLHTCTRASHILACPVCRAKDEHKQRLQQLKAPAVGAYDMMGAWEFIQRHVPQVCMQFAADRWVRLAARAASVHVVCSRQVGEAGGAHSKCASMRAHTLKPHPATVCTSHAHPPARDWAGRPLTLPVHTRPRGTELCAP